MQADSAINDWRQWGDKLRRRPKITRALSGGHSNRSFLLDAEGCRMVLRLNGADSLLPGSNRDSEMDIWQAASEAGIAPALVHVDKTAGYLVSDYVNGNLSAQSRHTEATFDKVFDLLNRCHRLDVDTTTIDYVRHIGRYWQIIENNNELHKTTLEQQRRTMRLLLEEIVTSDPQTGLCHHDPIMANFVGTADRLYLIDWEYAAHGLRVMDYAALGLEWGIGDSVIIERTGIEPELLRMAKSLYGYLCDLWVCLSADHARQEYPPNTLPSCKI